MKLSADDGVYSLRLRAPQQPGRRVGLLDQNKQIEVQRYAASRPPREFHIQVLAAPGHNRNSTSKRLKKVALTMTDLVDQVKLLVGTPEDAAVAWGANADALLRDWFVLRFGSTVEVAVWPVSLATRDVVPEILSRSSLLGRGAVLILEGQQQRLMAEPELPTPQPVVVAAQGDGGSSWPVPEKLQAQSGTADGGSRHPESVLWLNRLIEEYSHEQPDASFLEWATASRAAQAAVRDRFFHACRADKRQVETGCAPADWSVGEHATEATDSEISRAFMHAMIQDAFPHVASAKIGSIRLRQQDLAEFLRVALADEGTDHAEERAAYMIDIAGSGAPNVFEIGRVTRLLDKPSFEVRFEARFWTLFWHS